MPPQTAKRHRNVTRGVRVRKRGAGWQLDFNFKGKRSQKQYGTREEAEVAGRALMEQAKQEGLAALSLTPSQRQDAVRAIALLPDGVTLLDAITEWKKARPATSTITVPDAADRWLKAKQDEGLRPKTLNGYRFFARAIGDAFPIPVADLTTAMLKEWFALKGWTGVTRNSNRALVSAFLGWCVEEAHCPTNPAGGLKKARVDGAAVEILDAAASRRLLEAAAALHPAMVPYIAVGLFAGVRPAEARRLDWKAIEAEHIRIGAGVAKSRSQRLIDVRPNLRKWIDTYRTGSAGTLYWSRWDMRRIVEAADIEWTQDVLRHTFASMLLADTGDVVRTAHQMGHAGVDVLHAHYKALVTPQEAKKFWAIMPAEKVPSRKPTVC